MFFWFGRNNPVWIIIIIIIIIILQVIFLN
jgi:hypothetical protein